MSSEFELNPNLPFTFVYTTGDGGQYRQQALSYAVEGSMITFFGEVVQTHHDTGELTRFTSPIRSISNVVCVEMQHPTVQNSVVPLRLAAAAPPAVSVPTPAAPSPIGNQTAHDGADDDDDSGEYAPPPLTPTALDDAPPDNGFSLDAGGLEEWANSQTGEDDARANAALFIDGLMDFYKSQSIKPVVFHLPDYVRLIEAKGFQRHNISDNQMTEWVCNFIRDCKLPADYFVSEREIRVFEDLEPEISTVYEAGNRNPILVQNNRSLALSPVVLNNQSIFTVFKIAGYFKHKASPK